MPVFEYKALDSKGKKSRGLITADGPAAARLRLSQDLLFPTEIREVNEEEKRHSTKALVSPLSKLQRVNPVEVTTALRQLATLISSGLPLVESLSGVIEQSEEPKLRKIFTQVRERVLEGNSLAQAMSAHPGVFSHIHVNMVRAGETGGALDIILKRLADFSERRLKLKKRIESAMTYPIFLLLISSVILIFLMTFVMPKVVGIFKGMKLALPWSTQVLIFVTYVISHYWWLLALGAVGLGGGIAAFVRTENGGRAWDRIKMGFPLLGRLHRKAVIARFTRTLSILLKRSGFRWSTPSKSLGLPWGTGSLRTGSRKQQNSWVRDLISRRLCGRGGDFLRWWCSWCGPVKRAENWRKCLPRRRKSMKMMWRPPSPP